MYKQMKQLKTETKFNNEGKEKMFKTNLADFDASDPRIRLFFSGSGKTWRRSGVSYARWGE